MTQTIEQKAASTILQKPETITVGAATYSIAPPSTATLILVSEAITRLPHIRLDEKNVMEQSLAIAKDCRVLGEIAAILILGAKDIDCPPKRRSNGKKRRLWGLLPPRPVAPSGQSRKMQLSRELLENLSPSQLHDIIARTLMKMEVGDFFGLTTFLTGINLLRPTKVVTEATASGQSSQE